MMNSLKSIMDDSKQHNTVKVKFEVVDPLGVITDTFSFDYVPAYYVGRGILTIGNHQYMVTGNGECIYKINEFTEKLPIATRTVSDEELSKLKKWLESEGGKRTIRDCQEKAEETCKIIDELREIDPDKLREPFNI